MKALLEKKLLAVVALVVVAQAYEGSAKPAFLVPDRLYAAPGLECNIYYKDIFDSVVPQNYAFQTYADKGRSELTRWCWTPDVVLIELGVNNVFSLRGEQEELRATIREKVLPGFTRLIDALRPHMPDAVFALCTLPIGCSQDGFAVNYGAKWNEVQHRKIMFALNREIADYVGERNDGKILLVPLAQAVDPFHSYIHAKKPAHTRSKETAVRDQNAVHLSDIGGWQMGDTIAAWLRCRWNSLK